MTAVLEDLATRLRAALGPAKVITDRQELRTYECDGLAHYRVVPAIVALFWLLKLLTTGMGEAISDALGQASVPAAAVVGVVGFLVAMRMQLRAPAYRAPVYWFAVMMVAVFGTMAADGVHLDPDGNSIELVYTTRPT